MSEIPRLTADGRGRQIAAVAVLALGQAAAAGVAAFATRDIFHALRSSVESVPVAVPSTALALLLLSGFVIAACRIGERVVAERVGQNYAAALRLKLFTHVAKMRARDVARRRSGGLALRFVGDLQAVRGWVATGVARLVSGAIVIPVTAFVLFLLNPILGAAATVPLVLGLAAMVGAGLRLGPAHRRLRERRARLAADMSERLPHGPELRLLGRMRHETVQLGRRTEAVIEAAIDRAQRYALLQAMPDAIAGATAAALLFAAWRTGVGPAEAAGALAALGLLIQPIRSLAGVWDRRRAWVVARDKCLGVLAIPTLKREAPTASEPVPGTAALAFVDLAGTGAARFSAEVLPGEKVAIIGGNGAGKSTLLALAAGLETPADGQVLIAGRPVQTLSTADRRREIAFAGPRSPILKGTLRRALTLGNANVPDDDTLAHALATFGLDHLLTTLGGLDGTVLEGGRNLSSGEVRRILLARSMLARPSLLLLDEPDDALDPAGGRLLAQRLRELTSAVLLVTHDATLARAMDTIWFVVDGCVIESGPPSTVLAGDGRAARFFRPREAA